MNFIEIIDAIFINKHLYQKVSDEDKIANFFIINRKLGKGYPDIAKKFNHRGIDKASAIDMWAEYFRDQYFSRLPKWYWDPKKVEKSKSKIKELNYEKIKLRYEFSDDDISYLKKYFPEDLKMEMFKINKFEE